MSCITKPAPSGCFIHHSAHFDNFFGFGLAVFFQLKLNDCSVPATVPPGQYKLRMVAKPNNGEWRIVNLLGIGPTNRIWNFDKISDLITAMSLQSNVSSSINFVVR
jgi:hypothetical protein